MRLFIDATMIVSRKGATYHGVGDYGFRLIDKIIENRSADITVVLLWPDDYQCATEKERSLFESDDVQIMLVDDISTVDYTECDVLFLPLLSVARTSHVTKLVKVTKQWPALRIVGTLHDLRLFDLLRFDPSCKYYYKRGMAGYVFQYLKYWRRAALSIFWFRALKKVVDVVLFPSNFTMQRVQRYAKLKGMELNYLGIDAFPRKNLESVDGEGFILFVSGNRVEKNFIRTLEAYLDAVRSGKTQLRLYVTGSKEELEQIIRRDPRIDLKLVEKMVRFLGYISPEEMQRMYAACSFLLYTSKSEGFGLPALNAGIYGRPVLASSRTSVPEVLESAALYVDPYDKESITNGIEIMTKKLTDYERVAEKYRNVLPLRMEIGEQRTVDTILNGG